MALPGQGLTDQEALGSPGSCYAEEITAERGRHVEGRQGLPEMCGSLRIGCLSSVPLRPGQLTQLLESPGWEELLTGSCKQLPLLVFHKNPQFSPLVLPCSVSAMCMFTSEYPGWLWRFSCHHSSGCLSPESRPLLHSGYGMNPHFSSVILVKYILVLLKISQNTWGWKGPLVWPLWSCRATQAQLPQGESMLSFSVSCFCRGTSEGEPSSSSEELRKDWWVSDPTPSSLLGQDGVQYNPTKTSSWPVFVLQELWLLLMLRLSALYFLCHLAPCTAVSGKEIL